MKTSFEIEEIVFDLLVKSGVKDAINGGIYFQNDRPDNSVKEDIVINTISMTQDFYPQIATSNVNIYVPDKHRKIDGTEQLKPNHNRLSEISKVVIDVLRSSRIDGLKIITESQAVLQEPSIRQHFCNIRISWNIHT